MKESKRYTVIYMTVAILGILLVAGSTYILDPLFQYHMPWFAAEADVYDERYQNPGLIKNYEYDAIIVGSSLSENFNAEWFDDGYGVNTLKLTCSGATVQDIEELISMVTDNQKIKYVFGNIDTITLWHEFGKTRYELPEYLYDNNVFNDVKYLLNKEIWLDYTCRSIKNIWDGEVTELKNAYSWYEDMREDFSGERVISRIIWKEDYKNIEQKDYSVDVNLMKVVEQIKQIVLSNPETVFKFYYSPYSILHYYTYVANGSFDRIVTTYEYSMKILLECENIELYFPTSLEMITNLDKYKDLEHYDLDIQYEIFEQMRDGENRVTIDNYQEYVRDFKDMILNYDYEALIQKYKAN